MKFVTFVLTLAALQNSAFAADAADCKDSPLIQRFPGSEIESCVDKPDELASLPQSHIFEAELHKTIYRFPKTASKAEVYRNLKTALVKAGFEIPYDTAAGNGDFMVRHGKTWILEEVSGGGSYAQTVAIEIKLVQLMTANTSGRYDTLAQKNTTGVDAPGCTDSPLIVRFPKSVLTRCIDRPDDLATIPVDGKAKQIEGELHQSSYDFPPSSSKAEVYRNLKTALQNAGFTLVNDTSASVGDVAAHAGKNWILEEVSGGGSYRQTVVVEKQLVQEVTANADALYGGLMKNGHSAVYGILFDTGKDEIKPSSAAALQEIVKLLKKEPTLKIYVVGHTDNVGDVSMNLDLSRRRAAAVVHALVTEYKISSQVLDSFGAGPYAPVASNDREEGGRALNRRVELVKQ